MGTHRFLLMQIQNMSGNFFIDLSRVDIVDHKDTVKTRQDGGLKLYLLRNVLQMLHSSKDRVSCCQNRGSRIKAGRDSCLRDAYSLLFHGFMDSNSIT